ncbi:KLTH0D13662p [Lachancea thermotolerans CBS 6340]|uniref:KLTH0D13662p n=1 Tax=Lachancea thermotolerans (strain ATCC 56472 / CBS 6340 / NRRL Y-8284) TaxID=559295 RepID=C5DFB1_LACTC|nr:KLTH0D13662p [Lachancea thermotolerans CBS 6340]CAR22866.1 KLTH0D13662p [Lachancea thermotolerans CBS 6340]
MAPKTQALSPFRVLLPQQHAGRRMSPCEEADWTSRRDTRSEPSLVRAPGTLRHAAAARAVAKHRVLHTAGPAALSQREKGTLATTTVHIVLHEWLCYVTTSTSPGRVFSAPLSAVYCSTCYPGRSPLRLAPPRRATNFCTHWPLIRPCVAAFIVPSEKKNPRNSDVMPGPQSDLSGMRWCIQYETPRLDRVSEISPRRYISSGGKPLKPGVPRPFAHNTQHAARDMKMWTLRLGCSRSAYRAI